MYYLAEALPSITIFHKSYGLWGVILFFPKTFLKWQKDNGSSEIASWPSIYILKSLDYLFDDVNGLNIQLNYYPHSSSHEF